MNRKITNLRYRQFLDDGIIEPITRDELKKALGNVKGEHRRQGRSLLICLYYTGARPNEVLQLCSKDIKKEGNVVKISLKGSKRGLPRELTFSYARDDLVQELWHFSIGLFGEILLFHHFRNKYARTVKYKSGKVIVRFEISGKVRYYLQRWFKGVVKGNVTPYFFRHSIISQLALAGHSDTDLRLFKGSKTSESISHYVHLTSDRSKKLGKTVQKIK